MCRVGTLGRSVSGLLILASPNRNRLGVEWIIVTVEHSRLHVCCGVEGQNGRISSLLFVESLIERNMPSVAVLCGLTHNQNSIHVRCLLIHIANHVTLARFQNGSLQQTITSGFLGKCENRLRMNECMDAWMHERIIGGVKLAVDTVTHNGSHTVPARKPCIPYSLPSQTQTRIVDDWSVRLDSKMR